MGIVEKRSKVSGSVLHVSISYNISTLHNDDIQEIKRNLTDYIAENNIIGIINVNGFQPNSK